MPPLPPEILVAGAAAFAVGAAAAPVVRRPPARLQWAIAGAAAVAVAVGTDATPTGHDVIDTAYRALLAALLVLAAGHAALAPLAVATAIAVGVAWPDAVAGSAAAVALGIVIASALTRRHPFGHLAGALVAFALLRGAWPDRHGATAALAAVAFAVVVLGGMRRWAPGTRRRVRRGAAVAGTLLVVATGASAVVAWRATDAVERATDAAAGVARTARQGDANVLDSALGDARASFAGAKRWADGPWAWPARAVPVVAQHVHGLAQGAEAGAVLVERLERTKAGADLSALHVSDGGLDVSAVRRVAGALAGARDALHDARATLAEADSPWLLAPVQQALHRQESRLADAAADAEKAARLMALLPSFLGADGPRRYFLAVQTPVESRATGGLIGNFGEIVAEDGRIRLERFGRLRELNLGGTPAARTLAGPAEYLARYGRFQPVTTWQNVNMSPDFPTVADVVSRLYPQSGGAPIDGVVSVDPSALAALLRLTGPVRVPSWPDQLGPDNVEEALYFEQYRRFEEDERVDFLGEVAMRVTQRLTSMRIANVRRLVDVLGPAVRGRHLAVASARPEEQALLDDLRLSARIPPVVADSLSVVTQNASGNKIDWFLRRNVSYRAVVDEATGAIEAEVDVTLRNQAPATGLPKSIIGNVASPPMPSGTSRLFLSVYTPWRLDSSSLPLERGVELGRYVYTAFVDVPPGGEVRVHLALRGSLPGDIRYRLDFTRQPTVAPDDVRVDVRSRDGTVLARGGGRLEADRTFGAGGKGAPRR